MSLDDLPARVSQSGAEPRTVVRRVDRPSPLRDKVTRAEELRLQLADEIVRGVLPPGSALDETDIARRFSVSRTPVREALRQLTATGLVEMRPRRGVIVSLPGDSALAEMFEVMGELEAMCGRLAARRMLPAEHERLLAAHRACEAARLASDPDAYYYENERFHHLIYEGSHNGFLEQQASALHRRLRPYRRLQLRVRDRMPTSLREHEGVVQAILAGDAELTAQRLRDHVVVQGQRFADLIASLAELQNGSNPLAMPKPAGTSDAPSAETAVRRTVR